MDRRKLLLVVAAVVAVLGVALVFVYAKGADKRAAEKYDTTEVLVAKVKINPGESFDEALESGKVELADVAQGQVLEGADDESNPYQGSVALTTIYPNEQLIVDKFGGSDEVEADVTLPIPDGKIAISIAVEDAGRVGYFVRPGAEVAVISTLIERATQAPIVTRVLLERVTVLAAGDTSTITDTTAGDEEAETRHQAAAHDRRHPASGREGPVRGEGRRAHGSPSQQRQRGQDRRRRRRREPLRGLRRQRCLSSSRPTARSFRPCSGRCPPAPTPSRPPTGCTCGWTSTATSTSLRWARRSRWTWPCRTPRTSGSRSPP